MDVRSIRLSLPVDTFKHLISLFAENGCDTEEAATIAVYALLVRWAQRHDIPLTDSILQSGALLDIFVHAQNQNKAAR